MHQIVNIEAVYFVQHWIITIITIIINGRMSYYKDILYSDREKKNKHPPLYLSRERAFYNTGKHHKHTDLKLWPCTRSAGMEGRICLWEPLLHLLLHLFPHLSHSWGTPLANDSHRSHSHLFRTRHLLRLWRKGTQKCSTHKSKHIFRWCHHPSTCLIRLAWPQQCATPREVVCATCYSY